MNISASAGSLSLGDLDLFCGLFLINRFFLRFTLMIRLGGSCDSPPGCDIDWSTLAFVVVYGGIMLLSFRGPSIESLNGEVLC